MSLRIEAEEIDVAVRWWADQLRERPTMDNGDRSVTGAMVQEMALMIHNCLPKITDAQIGQFVSALRATLQSEASRRSFIPIGLDYHPDMMLQEACKTAGFDGKYRFPWETMMHIRPGLVSVGGSRGVPYRRLFINSRGWETLRHRAADAIDHWSEAEPTNYLSQEQIDKHLAEARRQLAEAEAEAGGGEDLYPT